MNNINYLYNMDNSNNNDYNENGFIAWSYRWMSLEKYLPQSGCEVFWTVLFSWVVMVFTLPALCIGLLFKKYRENPYRYGGFPTFAIQSMVYVIFLVVFEIVIKIGTLGIVETLILMGQTILGVIVIIAIFFAVMYAIVQITTFIKWLYRLVVPLKPNLTPKKRPEWLRLISEAMDAFTNKYCPKITWVNKENK